MYLKICPPPAEGQEDLAVVELRIKIKFEPAKITVYIIHLNFICT